MRLGSPQFDTGACRGASWGGLMATLPCPACGAPFQPGDLICLECGANLARARVMRKHGPTREESPSGPIPQPPPAQQPPAPPQQQPPAPHPPDPQQFPPPPARQSRQDAPPGGGRPVAPPPPSPGGRP